MTKQVQNYAAMKNACKKKAAFYGSTFFNSLYRYSL